MPLDHYIPVGIYLCNFEQIVNLEQDFTHCSGVSIVDFEQVNVGLNPGA